MEIGSSIVVRGPTPNGQTTEKTRVMSFMTWGYVGRTVHWNGEHRGMSWAPLNLILHSPLQEKKKKEWKLPQSTREMLKLNVDTKTTTKRTTEPPVSAPNLKSWEGRRRESCIQQVPAFHGWTWNHNAPAATCLQRQLLPVLSYRENSMKCNSK